MFIQIGRVKKKKAFEGFSTQANWFNVIEFLKLYLLK